MWPSVLAQLVATSVAVSPSSAGGHESSVLAQLAAVSVAVSPSSAGGRECGLSSLVCSNL